MNIFELLESRGHRRVDAVIEQLEPDELRGPLIFRMEHPRHGRIEVSIDRLEYIEMSTHHTTHEKLRAVELMRYGVIEAEFRPVTPNKRSKE